MKIRALSLLLAAATAWVPTFAAEKSTESKPALAVVVAENLQHRWSANDDFDRLDLALRDVAKKRQWPVSIAAERFAANTPDRDTELRIFTQPLREDVPGELTFRAWTTLTVKGAKHDFGIILFRYYPRAGENRDDTVDKIFRGAVNKMADKVEPLLWPKS